MDARQPVIIGVGQTVQRVDDLAEASGPIELMAESVRRAVADAALAAVPPCDSIRTVEFFTARYRDPGRAIARLVGIEPAESASTTSGGNSPQMLVNVTAAEIAAGQLDLAILTGGECWRSRQRARRQGVDLGWGNRADRLDVDRLIGSTELLLHPQEERRGIGAAPQVYAMFETAHRAARELSPDEATSRAARTWSGLSEVAATNPSAWTRRRASEDEIGTRSATNRMIGLPYLKLMNSNNDVDMSAAVIICSAERARELGVASDRWVFPLAGSQASASQFISTRWDLADTTPISASARAALDAAALTIDDIALFDLYSCFPSSLHLGVDGIGIPDNRPLTVAGGLSFAGGPWNNYVMHAIARSVETIRDSDETTHAMVWANGGYMTKHAVGLYGNRPPAHPFAHISVSPEVAVPRERPLPAPDAAGTGRIDAYTVMHDRDDRPATGHLSCILDDGTRVLGSTDDDALVAALTDGEWVGRSAHVDSAGVVQTLDD